MRILHTEWSGGFGGQEIRILNEMQEMRRRGCHLALATKEDARILPKAKEYGFTTFTLPFRRKTDIESIYKLHKIARNFDIINTHSGIDTWLGGLASIGSGAKFIRTRHLSNKIHPSRLNFINSLADFIITTGESIREAMIRENRIKPERILSIPTGIDTETFYKEAMKTKYNLPQNKLIIGNLGVLRAMKRQDVFIEVARGICQKYPDVFFVIAGSGDGQVCLENLAKEVNQAANQEIVRLLGHIENPAEFLATLDIFMLTSDRNEGVPQSLMQALAMEIPSIAGNIGSIADLHFYSQGKPNFILTQNPNLEEFIEALELLIRKERRILPSRDFICKNFSLVAMGEKTMQVYQNLLS
ncbi:glycosyltransferase family 4 protein [Helicobacter sp. UBA3407]|uniref:glycosyltransferase family 4 protein n=1 Tax=Helicobacter TaxID=209 RepID=UPI00261DC182|nr:glycosyltransferase family 4 protein [Helicobacter sp. UBA3407]